MDHFFGHDKMLVEGLSVLMVLLENEDNIFNFKNNIIYKGYNLEKINCSKDKYSIRIIPKKRKRKDRMFVLIIDATGKEIKIIDINKHNYKNK